MFIRLVAASCGSLWLHDLLHGGIMATWRYCVTRDERDGEIEYAIRELYTGEDGGLSWTADEVGPRGETAQELADDLARMSAASSRPVLDLTLNPPALISPIGIDR